MRTAIFLSLVFVIVIGLSGCQEKNTDQNISKESSLPLEKNFQVTGQKINSLKKRHETSTYPGQIVGSQESIIAAKTGGTITGFSLSLGGFVREGTTVATIDDTGNFVDSTQRGFQSAQIQQLYLSKESAEKSYKLAKKIYEMDKTAANKATRDIAKLQYESAQIGYRNALDAHSITAPFSGYVTQTFVSQGDSINPGEPIITISKTKTQKIRFFVDAKMRTSIKTGTKIKVEQNNKKWNATISSLAPQADPKSGKILVEAIPETSENEFPLSGVSVSVSIDIEYVAENGTIFLPISAIRTTQMGNFLFVEKDRKAKLVAIDIQSIDGEIASVTPPSDLQDMTILLRGSRLLKEGDPVSVTQ